MLLPQDVFLRLSTALEKVHFQVNRHWMDFVTDPVLVSASKNNLKMFLKVSTHLNDIGDDFSIGRKCLSVNRISAEFLRANDIGAV